MNKEVISENMRDIFDRRAKALQNIMKTLAGFSHVDSLGLLECCKREVFNQMNRKDASKEAKQILDSIISLR